MWIINCFLLIAGTVAAACGIGFYLRNREASSYIRFYILSFGISAAIWCFFFGVIGFCDNLVVCNFLRKIGVIGVVSFLVTETFLVTDISGANRRIVKVFRWLTVAAGITDYLIFSQNAADAFVREGVWTT